MCVTVQYVCPACGTNTGEASTHPCPPGNQCPAKGKVPTFKIPLSPAQLSRWGKDCDNEKCNLSSAARQKEIEKCLNYRREVNSERNPKLDEPNLGRYSPPSTSGPPNYILSGSPDDW